MGPILQIMRMILILLLHWRSTGFRSRRLTTLPGYDCLAKCSVVLVPSSGPRRNIWNWFQQTHCIWTKTACSMCPKYPYQVRQTCGVEHDRSNDFTTTRYAAQFYPLMTFSSCNGEFSRQWQKAAHCERCSQANRCVVNLLVE